MRREVAQTFVIQLRFLGLTDTTTNPVVFILNQVINACFYGLYAGIGLTLLQEQLPNSVGYTSALYSNAMKLGMMTGTTLTGVIGQFYSLQHAFLGATFGGLACVLIFIKKEKTMRAIHAAKLEYV